MIATFYTPSHHLSHYLSISPPLALAGLHRHLELTAVISLPQTAVIHCAKCTSTACHCSDGLCGQQQQQQRRDGFESTVLWKVVYPLVNDPLLALCVLPHSVGAYRTALMQNISRILPSAVVEQLRCDDGSGRTYCHWSCCCC